MKKITIKNFVIVTFSKHSSKTMENAEKAWIKSKNGE